MYCAAFHIGMEGFGAEPTGTSEKVGDNICKECMVGAGFAIFVVMYARKAKLAHNHTKHAERAVGTVRGY